MEHIDTVKNRCFYKDWGKEYRHLKIAYVWSCVDKLNIIDDEVFLRDTKAELIEKLKINMIVLGQPVFKKHNALSNNFRFFVEIPFSGDADLFKVTILHDAADLFAAAALYDIGLPTSTFTIDDRFYINLCISAEELESIYLNIRRQLDIHLALLEENVVDFNNELESIISRYIDEKILALRKDSNVNNIITRLNMKYNLANK